MAKEKKIESLTPEQEAMIPKYVEKFLAIGLSTEQVDRAVAEESVRKSYVYLKKTNPSYSENPEFVWADSPQEAIKLAAQYAKGDTNVTAEEIKAQSDLAFYGSFESYWVAFFAFCAEQLPVKSDELVTIVQDIVKNCGVYWCFEDLVVISPKPTFISFVDEKLHNEDGPSIQWANGDCIYSYKGQTKASLIEVVLAARMTDSKDVPTTEEAAG